MWACSAPSIAAKIQPALKIQQQARIASRHRKWSLIDPSVDDDDVAALSTVAVPSGALAFHGQRSGVPLKSNLLLQWMPVKLVTYYSDYPNDLPKPHYLQY